MKTLTAIAGTALEFALAAATLFITLVLMLLIYGGAAYLAIRGLLFILL